jgi:hypothetical protein
VFIYIRVELDHQMQSGSNAVVTKAWKELAQRRHERITAPSVDLARPSHVLVNRSPLQEVSECELFEGGRAAVSLELGSRDVLGNFGRHNELPEAKGRRENLAG